MTIRVKLFAAARDLVGRGELLVDVAEGARISDVRQAVEAAVPQLRTILQHSLWAVNAEYAGNETPVHAESEVALIPPVSGG
jgi:molybdopterin converting factor small subunit